MPVAVFLVALVAILLWRRRRRRSRASMHLAAAVEAVSTLPELGGKGAPPTTGRVKVRRLCLGRAGMRLLLCKAGCCAYTHGMSSWLSTGIDGIPCINRPPLTCKTAQRRP